MSVKKINQSSVDVKHFYFFCTQLYSSVKLDIFDFTGERVFKLKGNFKFKWELVTDIKLRTNVQIK